MIKNKIIRIYLGITGLLLTVIGSLTTFNPIEVKAGEGIELAGNFSALNDARAFGALLLATAGLSLVGAFKESIRKTSLIAVALLFTSIGVGRVFSILADGMPSDGIVKATGLELILGIAGIVLISLQRNK